jgi:hypothetical protein
VKLGPIHEAVSRALRPVDWSLFETSPLWLDLPEHGARVVHAGVQPGVPIERTKPSTLLRIRTVRTESTRGGDVRDVLWGARYHGPPHVVFGHNAAPGLQLHRAATGLDTGCVYGGRLTALVLAAGQRIPMPYAARRALLVSQPAARVYYVPSSTKSHARDVA